MRYSPAAAASFAAYAACFSLRAAFRVCHDLCSVFGFAFSRFFDSRAAGVVVEAIYYSLSPSELLTRVDQEPGCGGARRCFLSLLRAPARIRD